MALNILWLGNPEKSMFRGWWDMTILEDFFKGETHFQSVELIPEGEGAVVIIPGRSWVGKEKYLTRAIQKLSWCLMIIAGDEEGTVNIDHIGHQKLKVWVQNPIPGRHDKYGKLGCGYTPGIDVIKQHAPLPKSKDWFFAGQITHSRRVEMVKGLYGIPNGELLETKGFTQGFDHFDYLSKMADAKVAPCSSGPKTPDTFRLFEALELGCVPIADEATPEYEVPGFWNWLFDDSVPFPTTLDWGPVSLFIKNAVDLYPALNNEIQAWWMRRKMDLRAKIYNDARQLGADIPEDDITVIIPVSPIKSHPSTMILEETIRNVRYHHPIAKIIITFDGVREEQEELRSAYAEHIRRVLWISHQWGNVYPIMFAKHTHQVGMAREALKHVTTPLILYVEQDTPIVIDEPIDWKLLIDMIKSGESNVIRLHFEGRIPEAHRGLMIGEVEGKFQKTIQWSQRPHLALSDFYRQMLQNNFSTDASCFIEDKIHGAVQDDYGLYGMDGWNKWKLHIYCPSETNIKRSYHTDGRAQEKKYDERQVW